MPTAAACGGLGLALNICYYQRIVFPGFATALLFGAAFND